MPMCRQSIAHSRWGEPATGKQSRRGVWLAPPSENALRNLLAVGVLAVLLGCISSASAQVPAPALSTTPRPELVSADIPPEERELRINGIAPTPDACLSLLRDGLPPTVAPQRLPDTPVEKTQLAVDAMAILGKTRYRPAVDTLVSIARQELPKGVQQLVEIDVAQTAPDQRTEFRARAAEILQYNAVNALGLIGDNRALPVAYSVFENEKRPAPKIQYALTLACLGDASGVDYLVSVIQMQNRRESVAAARAFAIITGQDFGYTEQTPIKRRKQLARAYQEWWASNRKTFRVDPKQVLARRLTPQKTATFQPRSTRDLLRLSSQYFEMDAKPKVIEARERLAAAGTSLNADLEKLMFDDLEDLNIRLEAMNWYYEINRAQARDAFRRLRRDPNPEIVDKANVLLEKIDRPDSGNYVIPGQR